MQIENKFTYKNPIILTPNILKELEAILLDYYAELKYRAILINKSAVTFDNLDELLAYDNFSKKRIDKLEIFNSDLDSYGDLRIRIEVEIYPLTNYLETVVINYKFKDLNNEILFVEKIRNILDKSKPDRLYIFLSKFPLYLLLFILSIIFFTKIINLFVLDTSKLTIFIIIFSFFIGILSSILFIRYHKVFTFSYPPIVFLFGEEIERIKNLSKARNLIYGSIGTIILGLITSYIFKLFG